MDFDDDNRPVSGLAGRRASRRDAIAFPRHVLAQ